MKDTVSLVERFVEKPNLETAQAYVNEGCYFWNAGIFVLKDSVWLKAMVAFQPELANASPSRRALGGGVSEDQYGRTV